MFSVSLSTVNRKTKTKVIAVATAFMLTILAAVIISLCCSPKAESESQYVFDLAETGGVGGFLSQFGLFYERQESKRELTLPQSDDELFVQYGEFQQDFGLNVLKFSGKKVEERYLRLKNKSKRGQQIYAVLYIYKEQIIATHLTTLEQDSQILPITAFV